MIENGARYSSRQWMLISFLALIIITSLLLITEYSGLGNHIAMVASGRQVNYLDTVDFPDIEELEGLFPQTDNTNVPTEVEGIMVPELLESITPITTQIITQTAVPSPTKIIYSPSKTATPTPTTVMTRDYSKPWTIAPGCPSSTMNCVPCLIGTNIYCRVEVGESHGFLGWSCQNNNPGNIRPAKFKDDMIVRNGGVASCGIRYDINGGSFMVFSDYYTGFNALKAYIRGINNGEHSSYQDAEKGIYCGDCSIKFFFSKYAPSNDNNDPDAYALYVANRLGISIDTTLAWVVDNKLEQFAEAIKSREGFITQ